MATTAVALLWGVVLLRAALLLRRPSAVGLWFVLGLAGLAAAITTFRYGPDVDAATGVTGAGQLVQSLSFAVAAMGVSVQMTWVRGVPRRGSIEARLAYWCVIGLAIGGSWLLLRARTGGTLGGSEAVDLHQVVREYPVEVLLYCVPFYLSLEAVLCEVAWTAAVSWRVSDWFRRVPLMFAWGAVTAGSVSVMALLGSLCAGMMGESQAGWQDAGRAAMPAAGGFAGLTVLGLIAGPLLQEQVQAAAARRALRPLWRWVVAQQPEVVLPGAAPSLGRMMTEIDDALHVIRVDPSLDLAVALRRPYPGGVPAASVLGDDVGPVEGLRRLVKLGKDFQMGAGSTDEISAKRAGRRCSGGV